MVAHHHQHGQGAQSVVWLAFDPRLEREVAIKLMKIGDGATMTAIPQWLQEARHVSRLSHPNIIPVFEADVQDPKPRKPVIRPRGYGENFATDRRGAWTH